MALLEALETLENRLGVPLTSCADDLDPTRAERASARLDGNFEQSTSTSWNRLERPRSTGVDIDAHRSLAALLDQCMRSGVTLKYFGDTLLRAKPVVTMLKILRCQHPGSRHDA